MKRVIYWPLCLFCLCFFWAYLSNIAMRGSSSFTQDSGIAFGMSLPIFIITGVISGIFYCFTKNYYKTLWVWTILIIISMLLLGIGALRATSVVAG